MAEIVSLPTKAGPAKPPFWTTPTAEDVFDVLRICQSRADFGVIVGAPGVGKTAAALAYASDADDAHFVTITPAASALVPCLERIANGLGCYLRNAGANDIHAAIVERLGGRFGAATILIIDEAQHLCDPAIEQLRSIYDELRHARDFGGGRGLGLVLIGNRGLIDRWEAKPGAKRDAWAQLTSRIGQRLDIPKVTPEDIAAVCDGERIAGKAARDFLHRHAQAPGGLRIVTKLLADAALVAGGRIELTHLQGAAALRGLGS